MALIARLSEAERLTSRSGAVIALGVVVALLYFGRVFFITFFAAVTIAFILEPFVALLMRLRFPRNLASFLVCSLGLLVVYLLAAGAYAQISDLIVDLPKYSQRISTLVDESRAKIEELEKRTYELILPRRREPEPVPAPPAAKTRKRRQQPEPPPALPQPPPVQEVRVLPQRTMLVDYLYSRLGSVYQILLMISFVPFLVYFMLSWRDHIYRSFLQFFSGEDRVVAAKSLQGVADMVRGFVVGNFVLGLLLAVASAIVFWKMGLPYFILIGPLSGFLSLIPYIGFPLALVPPLFFALTVFNTLSSYLIVAGVVALMHTLTLNLLYPKLVGSRVHLNPLVVTVALMGWGFLWDAAGLVLAIPLTAGIKAVCDNVRQLRPYGKFLGD